MISNSFKKGRQKDKQVFVSSITPTKDLMKPIKNDNKIKPLGGLWTSTFIGNEEISEWVKWCKSEVYKCPAESNTYLVIPKSEVKLLIVDSVSDLKRILDDYPIKSDENSFQPEYDFYPDFERMVRDGYDGFRITDNAILDIDEKFVLNYMGYDAESTIWFRWVFEEIINLGIKPYQDYQERV